MTSARSPKIASFHTPRWLLVMLALLLTPAQSVSAEDLIELSSGAKVRGQITERTDSQLTVQVKIGSRTLTRKYALTSVAAITQNGKREAVSGATTPNATATATSKTTTGAARATAEPAGGVSRSKAEVEALIEQLGRTPPDWYENTPLNYPQTLDLSWPEKPEGNWDNKKNVGQYLWDVMNPNPGKWREGIKLMHHIMSVNQGKVATQKRAMGALGRIYHNLLEDYARAAFWWRKGGLEGGDPASSVHLAECYWRLGNKAMAVEQLGKSSPHMAMVKLLADMGDTDKALQLAEAIVRGGNPDVAYVMAGDACRVASRFAQALDFYRKALDVPATGNAKARVERNHDRAKASIEAITLFETLDLKRVPDGKYRAKSLGYEGQIEVEVTVAGNRIANVQITDHKEKQFYSALTDTPRKIIARQGVRGVDATSSATITSEAIINATAKGLAGAMK